MLINITNFIRSVISNTVPQLINPLFKYVDKEFARKSEIQGSLNYLETSANDIVKLMGAGWNLANSFNGIDDSNVHSVEEWEQIFGNPVTTYSIIKAVSDRGFKTLRIPVSFKNHLDENNIINTEWLNRIEEIVNYGLKTGMFVILTISDTNNDYITSNLTNISDSKNKLANLWNQLGNRFANYDYRLMFESHRAFNINNPTTDNFRSVNELNQTFVDTIRSIQGNENRFLLCPVFGKELTNNICADYKLPYDTVEDKLIVEVNDYGKLTSEVNTLSSLLEKYFISKDIPVVIGEFGVDILSSDLSHIMREEEIRYYVSNMRQLGVPVIVWDDNDSYKIFNRFDCTWEYDEIAEIIINISNSTRKIDYKYLDETYNLFNANNWRLGMYRLTDGGYVYYDSSDMNTMISSITYLLPKYKSYKFTCNDDTISVAFVQLGKDFNFISSNTLNNNDSINIDVNTKYIGISVYKEDVVFNSISEMVIDLSNNNFSLIDLGTEDIEDDNTVKLNAHINNSEIHVTKEDKERWDNNSGGSTVNKISYDLLNCNSGNTYNIDLSDKNINLYNSIIQLFKIVEGERVVSELLNFGDESQFTLDQNSKLEFDGTNAILNTEFITGMTLNSDGLYETEEINKSEFRNFTIIGEVE